MPNTKHKLLKPQIQTPSTYSQSFQLPRSYQKVAKQYCKLFFGGVQIYELKFTLGKQQLNVIFLDILQQCVLALSTYQR